MLVRIAVLILLLANAAYFAWAQGLLRSVGLAPVQQSEPARLNQQIRPEVLKILSPEEAAAQAAAAAAAAEPAVCLEAGVFDAAQAEAVRTAAAALPEGSWSLEQGTIPGSWMVYMGRFPEAGALDKKRAELRARKINFERAGVAYLEPGLSLGRFASEAEARSALNKLNAQGVRTARVVRERPEAQGLMLRLPEVRSGLRAQLEGEAMTKALAGHPLRECP